MSKRRLLVFVIAACALCVIGALLYASLAGWLPAGVRRAPAAVNPPSSIGGGAVAEVEEVERTDVAASAGPKTILYWNDFFGVEDFELGEGEVAGHCPGPHQGNCRATSRRHMRGSPADYDALVFHGINEEFRPYDVPAERGPEQSYVFVSLESPANRYVSPYLDGFFNLTMSYLLDSDVVWRYSDVVEAASGRLVGNFAEVGGGQSGRHGAEEEDRALVDKISGKKRLAIWYRSNCQTRSGRENYVAELERYMDVASFGGCSSDPGCPKSQDCLKTDVEPNYFFYLAFENSFCNDYITEKFFNPLRYYVVPVVYGGANYSIFAPPKSYINALDFAEPKDLARFLIDLSQNITEYRSYFEWKKHYRVILPYPRMVCDMCKILHENRRKTYAISKWYSRNTCPLQIQLDNQVLTGGLNYLTGRNALVT